jgi:hypothetical protein
MTTPNNRGSRNPRGLVPLGRPSGTPRRPVRDGVLLAARTRAGMTGQMAADALTKASGRAVKPTAIYQWERGERTPPEWAVVEMAKAYRIKVGGVWA